jgi:hypothetical protein
MKRSRIKRRRTVKAFAHRRVPEYAAWVRTTFRCWFCQRDGRRQLHRTECEHLRTRSAGGDDYDNILPTCAFHRTQRDIVGPKTFFAQYGDVFAAAKYLTAMYKAALR